MVIYFGRYTSHTIVSGSGDSSDLVELAPGSTPTTYTVDGVEKAGVVRTETILPKFGAPLTFNVLDTEFGPVWNDLLEGVPPQRRFAARFTEYSRLGTHSILSGLALLRAHSLTEYREALALWTTPNVYALYAGVDKGAPSDDQGHIAFHVVTAIPKRAVQVVDELDVTGRYPLDGASASNDWAGILGFEWNPSVVDPPEGYLFNGNSLPAGSWFTNAFYSGVGVVGDTTRSYALRERLGELLGSPAAKVSPEQVHALHFDGSSPHVAGFRALLKSMVGLSDADGPFVVLLPSLDMKPASAREKAGHLLAALDQWFDAGASLRRDDPVSPLIEPLLKNLKQESRFVVDPTFGCKWNGGEGGPARLFKELASHPTALTSIEMEFALRVAEKTWDAVAGSLPTNPSAWPVPAPFLHPLRYRLPFFPAPAALDAPDYDHPGGARGSLHLVNGFSATINASQENSFPLTANFAALDESRTLAAVGMSDDPASPHFIDGVSVLEDKSRKVDTLPTSPLSWSALTLVSTENIVYNP